MPVHVPVVTTAVANAVVSMASETMTELEVVAVVDTKAVLATDAAVDADKAVAVPLAVATAIESWRGK